MDFEIWITQLPNVDIQIPDVNIQIQDFDVQIQDLDVQIGDLDVQIRDIDFKIWILTSKSWIWISKSRIWTSKSRISDRVHKKFHNPVLVIATFPQEIEYLAKPIDRVYTSQKTCEKFQQHAHVTLRS